VGVLQKVIGQALALYKLNRQLHLQMSNAHLDTKNNYKTNQFYNYLLYD